MNIFGNTCNISGFLYHIVHMALKFENQPKEF